MDNMNLIKKLPPMLSGSELEQALTILPEYDPAIINENEAMRLIALTDIYKVFVPNQMSREIYSKHGGMFKRCSVPKTSTHSMFA